jgi:hypothetical protein
MLWFGLSSSKAQRKGHGPRLGRAKVTPLARTSTSIDPTTTFASPNNRNRAPKLSNPPTTISPCLSNRSPAYVQPSSAMDKRASEANDRVTDAPPTNRARPFRCFGYVCPLYGSLMPLVDLRKLTAHTRTPTSYANNNAQDLVLSLATAGGTVRERQLSKGNASPCVSNSNPQTHTSKATTSPLSVTVTHSTRSSRTTVLLLLARTKRLQPAKQDFLCSGSIEMRSH